MLIPARDDGKPGKAAENNGNWCDLPELGGFRVGIKPLWHLPPQVRTTIRSRLPQGDDKSRLDGLLRQFKEAAAAPKAAAGARPPTPQKATPGFGRAAAGTSPAHCGSEEWVPTADGVDLMKLSHGLEVGTVAKGSSAL